jgi:hypothetical protein
MRHLTAQQVVDAAEGDREQGISAHLLNCRDCTTRVDEMRAMLDMVASVPALEPSPLFWEHFGARVNAAIDAPASSGGWIWTGVILIAIGFFATRTAIVVRPDRVVGTVASTPQADGPTDLSSPAEDRLEEDAAWAVMQSLAIELHYDDVAEAGVLPRAGSVERAATELPPDERAELVRLIQDELKRTGA